MCLLLLFELMTEVLIIQMTLEIAEVKQNSPTLSTAPDEYELTVYD